ncbi:thioesterase II family protein [Metapseudomonas resinovorans]|uniref:Putative thioesterase n=1 Tax=Metapseudomonas resinovorans NBRC 106553 TaxID=1245471 RepID=S6AS37_METRE|nr:alpha/beta fold hydrolase [Pseudomonas resinovorans]BAN48813.1 putative thioesterase [Pseudomonas resinovorans NBRC 106553]
MVALRLFCMPYSGASAMAYARWRRKVPQWLAIRPVELPGRGARHGEPFATDVLALARGLAVELRGEAQQPYALFGHSLGGLLAFEMAHALNELGLPRPVALFVSGTAAPAKRDFSEFATAKSDAELIAKLRGLGGTPEAVLANRELLDLLLPVLRADFLLCGQYRYRERSPLPLPIHVFGGREDSISVDDLLAWQGETASSFSLDMHAGHHFFIHDNEARVLRTLKAHLGRHLRYRSSWGWTPDVRPADRLSQAGG